MEKRKQTSSLKYVCAIAMSLFSLVALFVGTFAWFNSVRALQNGADDFNVKPASSMIKSVSVYNQATTQNSRGTPYVFNSNPVVTYTINQDKVTKTSGDPNNISINYYSPLFGDSTLLYLFEIDKSTNETENEYFSINIKTDTPDSAESGANGTEGSLVYKSGSYAAHQLKFDVDETTKQQLISGSNGKITEANFGLNSMSSIIAFDVFDYTSMPATTNGVINLTADFTGENKNAVEKSFVSQDTPTEGQQEHDYTFSYATYDIAAYTWNKGEKEICPKYVAVVCHYNAASLQYIYNLNLGNPAADYEEIKFTCDWYYELS